MKASELIARLEEAIQKVGDLEICMVHPTGVEVAVVVCTQEDYYNDGYGIGGGECAHGKIAIDYDYDY